MRRNQTSAIYEWFNVQVVLQKPSEVNRDLIEHVTHKATQRVDDKRRLYRRKETFEKAQYVQRKNLHRLLMQQINIYRIKISTCMFNCS